MIGMTQNYKWVGDGVLATLTVRHSDDIRRITYSIDLECDDLALQRRRDETNLARKLAEGNAQGWNSTAKEREGKLARKARIKTLEENAQRRGDTIVLRKARELNSGLPDEVLGSYRGSLSDRLSPAERPPSARSASPSINSDRLQR